jgi:MFS family permease
MRSAGSASAAGARAGARSGRSVNRFWHRVTGASGAGRTGLGALIELTSIGGAGDAFVAVSLAGTIFFSTPVEQARGRVVLFLLVTMAPFAVLAPFIGPFLDRMQSGRRYLLAGSLLARGLLCWGMSAAVSNPWTLLPAAFGILVLQKAYGVARAAVTPRLLPAEITLVAANARSQLIALVTAMIAAPAAALIQLWGGAAWVLRVATVVYFAAVLVAVRLPEHVDTPATPAAPPAAPPPAYPTQAPTRRARASRATLPLPPGSPGQRHSPADGAPPYADAPPYGGGAADAGASPADGNHPPGRERWRTLRNVGPVVAEAMQGNAVLRAFSGYIFFFLAFVLRTGHFGVSHNLALGAMVAGASVGGLAAMAIGSTLKARGPHLILFAMLVLAPVMASVCAWFFGLGAAVLIAFTATCCAGLAKLSQDSIVQHEIGEEIRSSAFAVSETLNQVSNVAGALAGVLVSMLNNGTVGLVIPAVFLTAMLVLMITRRRRRVLQAAAAR